LTTLLTTGVVNAATLNEMQLDGLLTGNTVYLSVPPGGPPLPEGVIVPVKYGADGVSAARLSSKITLVGKWILKGDHYCVDWENGPKNSGTKIVKTETGIELIDLASGETRGTVERIVPGNPEEL